MILFLWNFPSFCKIRVLLLKKHIQLNVCSCLLSGWILLPYYQIFKSMTLNSLRKTSPLLKLKFSQHILLWTASFYGGMEGGATMFHRQLIKYSYLKKKDFKLENFPPVIPVDSLIYLAILLYFCSIILFSGM